MADVFIIGSRGLPAKYGGFETFVEELIRHQVNHDITYHVACLSDSDHGTHFTYLGVDCFTVKALPIGSARVIAYDIQALQLAFKQIKAENIQKPIFYILGNTMGAIIKPFAKKIKQTGGKLYINPDGLEWKRSKWSRPIQAYLKYSEKVMAEKADLVIADNGGIETYLQSTYPSSKTTCIAYGTDLSLSQLTAESSEVIDCFDKWQIESNSYYLIVGRFVPENNYETMVREFMASKTKKDLIIICNHAGNAYFETLKEVTGFDKDSRIKFVGTVYDKQLLAYIREQAFAYLHGHEVGGTNPGLLEALAHTDVNLILDVTFNREVAHETALYWTKDKGSLTAVIDKLDLEEVPRHLGQQAKERMKTHYSWEKIVAQYEDLFLNEG